MDLNDSMKLIGHLQVMDEPLSSLYYECKIGRFFISIRLYEDNDVESYMFAEITPKSVLEYMNGKLGLKDIFCVVPSFYFSMSNTCSLSLESLQPLSLEDSCRLFTDEASLGDMFDINLAYKSVSLKNCLRNYK